MLGVAPILLRLGFIGATFLLLVSVSSELDLVSFSWRFKNVWIFDFSFFLQKSLKRKEPSKTPRQQEFCMTLNMVIQSMEF